MARLVGNDSPKPERVTQFFCPFWFILGQGRPLVSLGSQTSGCIVCSLCGGGAGQRLESWESPLGGQRPDLGSDGSWGGTTGFFFFVISWLFPASPLSKKTPSSGSRNMRGVGCGLKMFPTVRFHPYWCFSQTPRGSTPGNHGGFYFLICSFSRSICKWS